MKAAAANADKAIEDWKMYVLDREYLDKIQEDRVTHSVSGIAKIQKEGSLAESATDVNYLYFLINKYIPLTIYLLLLVKNCIFDKKRRISSLFYMIFIYMVLTFF